ncbi:MAG: serine/threonine protein kinase with repeat [Acidobacteria bacterium]|nr:serine/threonine protein kinase with repeat [Acidobacteriota bacterium]
MISHHLAAGSFIEQPAYEVAAETLAEDDPGESLVGKSVGSYVVQKMLDRGGMGTVYLAFDKDLHRQVALKFLHTDLVSDAGKVQRFRQEARAASALNHHNILTIHEIGETDDGRHFIATEFVDGETLRALMTRKPITLTQALDMAAQIASALVASHAAGIVHRDIKPENIMLRRDGYVKVLDFGLAKLIDPEDRRRGDSTLVDTAPGIIIGTVRYMSPEQVRGLDVDERTDIWSFGVVLYELLAGEAPFMGTTRSDMIASILQNKPSFTWRTPEIPAELEWTLKKALAKDREERYVLAREFFNDLKRLRRELPAADHWETAGLKPGGLDANAASHSSEPTPTRHGEGTQTETQLRTKSPKVLLESNRLSSDKGRSRKAINSVAILPLLNDSADPNAEYLSDGITESIINNLSQLPRLRVMARSTVFRYKGRDIDPLEVGRELNVHAVLTGRVLQLGDSLRIGTELVRVSDGSQLWGQHFNQKPGDIFAVQEEIAKQISEKLQMQLSGEEKKRLGKRYTDNTQAYQLYLQGRYHWNKRSEAGMKKGIQFFEEAIRLDPNYALAHAGLADSYIILGFYGLLAPKEVMPRVKAAAKMALRIDDTLAEARISLAYAKGAYDWDWLGAEKEYKRAIKLNRNYATAHHWYGEYLAFMGRSAEAAAELERAHELDPLSLIINVALGWIYYLGRRYDDAIKQLYRTLELDPNFVHARFCLGLAYVQKEMFSDAIDELQKVVAMLGRDPGALAALGYAYGVSGNMTEARKLLAELMAQSEQRYVAPYRVALVCIGLRENDQAFTWLQKGCEEHDLGLACLKVEAMADSLRSDPRYEELLRRVGFV